MTLIETARTAMASHSEQALAAYEIFKAHCDHRTLYRVPGMGTVTRLAIRIHHGLTVEEAAAREYVYRWRLALQSPTLFDVPHSIGM